jgi:hypothetical protein
VKRPLHILLLCDNGKPQAGTVLDHIEAFNRYSGNRVWTYNPRRVRRPTFLDFGEFDAVVLHYTLFATLPLPFSDLLRSRLAAFTGLKVAFVQDEYRWVDDTTRLLRELGIGVLFTAAGPTAAALLYDQRLPGVRRCRTLTGFVPEALSALPPVPLRERPLDVAYRGRTLPYWLGSLTQEKASIAQRFLEHAPARGLKVDIGWLEGDRVYGQGWIDLLRSARATLGTESGASIADFDGSVQRSVEAYLKLHPDASFDEVREAVLEPYEGNVVVNVISPRVFEAAALHTALVMFPGEYSNLVEPGTHYLPLAKDFSNFAEVAAQLGDLPLLEKMIERTYLDVVASGRNTYRAFIEEFDQVVAESVEHLGRTGKTRYRLAKAARGIAVPPPHERLVAASVRAMSKLPFVPRRVSADPAGYLSKGSAALAVVLRDPPLRRLLGAYLRSPELRRSLKADDLLEELVELAVLRRRQFPVEGAVASDGAITIRSLRSGEKARELEPSELAAWLKDPKPINWDHRARGRTVSLGKLEIAVGLDGRQRFHAIELLARHKPRLVAGALEALAR